MVPVRDVYLFQPFAMIDEIRTDAPWTIDALERQPAGFADGPGKFSDRRAGDWVVAR